MQNERVYLAFLLCLRMQRDEVTQLTDSLISWKDNPSTEKDD